MSTTPRLPSAVAGRRPTFATMLAHQPQLTSDFWELYATMWSHGVVDHVTKETVRLRNARVTDCGFCRNVRFDRARAAGLGEDLVDEIRDGYEQSTLPDAQKRALRFIDAYLADGRIGARLRADLIEAWSPEQTVEIAVAAALFMGFAKLLITLGAEPDGMETTIMPTPDLDHQPLADAVSERSNRRRP